MSFTVYRSSAGSGKTYTLVKEYLGIVLSDQTSFRNILAITFTNKAANEMRERIIRSLTEIAEPEKHEGSGAVKYMLPELQQKTGLESAHISERAARVLSEILHHYQDFSVSTIDSFVHRIIRTFAFDLYLPLNFEVEVDDDIMVGMAVDLLLNAVGVDENSTRVLTRFTESKIAEEENWDIEKDLKKFSKHLLKDDIAEFIPSLESMETETLLEIAKKLYALVNEYENELSSKAKELMGFWEIHGLDMADLYYKGSGIWGYIKRFAEKDFSKMEPNTNVEKTIEKDIWYSNGIDEAKKAVIDGLKNEMNAKLEYILAFIESNVKQYAFYSLLKKNIFPLAVLNEISHVIRQIRENDGLIHISDFDKKIADVVNKEPVPFIYERLGEKYKYFLIDEFQDTSVLEWQNILPLVENSLAEAHFNMIVGDAKQAIYRFKGGEVEQLVDLPKIYRKQESMEMDAREQLLIRTYNIEPLPFNFRSREEVIKFNNSLYKYVSEHVPDTLKRIYSDAKQLMPSPKPGGEVCISFVEKDGKKTAPEAAYLEKILLRIQDLTANKHYALSDIAILCRSNANASKIARFLLTHGIDVVSAESLLLRTSQEVNFLISCLDFVANTDDRLALTEMITYLSHHQENGPLHQLFDKCLPSKKSVEQGSRDTFYTFLKERNIDFSPDEINQMGLYEKTEALVRLFSLNDYPDPYVLFFLDAVFEYSKNNRFPPEDFTSFWRENNKKYSIIVPEGMNAVRVMTIHKAKGLEFPVVIYPFANERVKTGREQRWVHVNEPELPGLKTALLPISKQLEQTNFSEIYNREKEMAQLDMLNILYVATTRPTERLYIICDQPSASDEMKNVPSILRSFIEDREMYEETVTEYSFGSDEPLPKQSTIPEPALYPEKFIASDWRKNILLSGHAAEHWDLEDEGRNLEWGNLVHRVLSKVETISDLEAVVAGEVISGSLSEDRAEGLFVLLKSIITNPEVIPFFDGRYEVKNESGILEHSGKEYRPDRLMIDSETVIVLDYKTGKEDPAHHRQINLYGQLLLEIGFAEVEKYLLYLDADHHLVKI